MSQELNLRRVRIHRFPGFPPTKGFSVTGFGSGINVVYGPNASGKTTLARTIFSLFWPEASPDKCHVDGVFVCGENSWFVENDSGKITFERDGREVEATQLPVPPAETRHRYRLSLHHLLQQDTTNSDLAESIIREAAGGYDLRAVAENLDFRERPSNAGRETDNAVDRRLKRLNKLKEEARNLGDLKESLPELESELKEARRAEKRVTLLKGLIEYKDAEGKLEELKNRRDSYPEVMDEVTGNEKKRLEGVENKITEAKKKKDEAIKSMEEAEVTLKKVSPGKGRIGPDLITELEKKIDRLERLEEKREAISQDIAEKEAERNEITARLSREISDEVPKNLTVSGVDDLTDFAREAEEVRAGLKASERLKGWLLEKSEVEHQLDDVRRGRRLLEEWLQLRSSGGGKTRGRRTILFFGLLNAAGGVISGLLFDPVFFTFLLPSLVFIWFGADLSGESRAGEDRKKLYLELGLKRPKKWDEKSVRQLTRKLSNLEATIRLERKKREFWSAVREEVKELRKDRERLVNKKRGLAEKYGVAPEIDEGKLHWLIKRINSLASVDEALSGLRKKLETVKRSLTGLRKELNEKLTDYGYEATKEAAVFRGYVRELDKRRERGERARDKLNTCRSRKKEAETRLAELKSEKAKLFEGLDLAEGDRAKLVEYAEKKYEYREIKSLVKEQAAICESKLSSLKSREEFEENLLQENLSRLQEKLENAKRLAAKKEDMIEKISGIKERLREKKNESEMEMARAELTRSFRKLEEQLFSDYEEMAGKVLLDYLREEGLRKSRPEVFSRANEIFTDVTRGNYRLEIKEGTPPSFLAIAGSSGKARELNELSSGTRLQLLASVRLAFIEKQEESAKLPLILDEVLANSDDVRAEEIMDLALQLSSNGRQVIYLTARGDEVAKWRNKLASNDSDGRFIDLAEERKLEKSLAVPDRENSGLRDPDLPRPESMNHREYGEELEVPAFNPRQGAGSAHLWYPVEDPESLCRLLKSGMETWGQLKNVLRVTPKTLSVLSEEEEAAIRSLGSALEAYVDSWTTGRNRRVDRSVIKDSGAVTDNFLEEVMDLLDKYEGDPEKVISGLKEGEVSSFRSNKRKELENYFRENGYLTDRAKLSREEIIQRMLASAREAGNLTQATAVYRLYARLER